MYYDLPTEITSSQCWYLTSNSQIIAYPNNRTRWTFVRSGSEWFLSNTQTTTSQYGYDWSSYNCLSTTRLPYEYDGIKITYDFYGFILATAAIGFAFWLVIYRFFKGGHKW